MASAQAFTILPDVLALPRAFHTATLLTDGLVLFAGGVIAGGAFPDDIQLWDYRSKRALSHHALLATPRQGHTAALLAGGSVRVSGGTDRFGRPVITDEIYDPVSKRFRTANNADAAESNPGFGVAASIPADGSAEVPLQDPIAIRFSRLLNVATATEQNFVLTGPDQALVGARVTAAEGGRLVFVLPSAPLQPGTHYVLRIANARNKDNGSAGDVLPETIIAFDTEGAPPDGPGPDWTPNSSSSWTDPGGITKFQQLPPLLAHPGTTALSGQTLKLNGWPLEHVTLEMEGKKVRTDSTGRFLLTGLTPGHHVLWVDGSTANHPNAVYGVHEIGVTIVGGKTNVLNYTIWMTRLDMAHAINIPSPTTAEMVITTPTMPGLELRLRPNTRITDRNGKVVRQITITPVPLDKPPFPLPVGVQVPIYFTIQPGGAYITVKNAAPGAGGAQLIYPNAFHLKPGSPFDFWNYDADAKGWFIYGQGKVSDDGNNIIPDPGVVIYEFTGAMEGGNGTAQAKGRPVGSEAVCCDPIDLSTGQYTYTKTDLVLPDTIPVALTRTYNTNDSRSRSFGVGTTDSYDFFMGGNTLPYTFQELIKPDGGRVRFDRISAGTSYSDAVYAATSSDSEFYGALLSWNTDPTLPGAWKIVMKNGTILSFPEAFGVSSPFCQAVIGIKDRYGNTTRINRG